MVQYGSAFDKKNPASFSPLRDLSVSPAEKCRVALNTNIIKEHLPILLKDEATSWIEKLRKVINTFGGVVRTLKKDIFVSSNCKIRRTTGLCRTEDGAHFYMLNHEAVLKTVYERQEDPSIDLVEPHSEITEDIVILGLDDLRLLACYYNRRLTKAIGEVERIITERTFFKVKQWVSNAIRAPRSNLGEISRHVLLKFGASNVQKRNDLVEPTNSTWDSFVRFAPKLRSPLVVNYSVVSPTKKAAQNGPPPKKKRKLPPTITGKKLKEEEMRMEVDDEDDDNNNDEEEKEMEVDDEEKEQKNGTDTLMGVPEIPLNRIADDEKNKGNINPRSVKGECSKKRKKERLAKGVVFNDDTDIGDAETCTCAQNRSTDVCPLTLLEPKSRKTKPVNANLLAELDTITFENDPPCYMSIILTYVDKKTNKNKMALHAVFGRTVSSVITKRRRLRSQYTSSTIVWSVIPFRVSYRALSIAQNKIVDAELPLLLFGANVSAKIRIMKSDKWGYTDTVKTNMSGGRRRAVTIVGEHHLGNCIEFMLKVFTGSCHDFVNM